MSAAEILLADDTKAVFVADHVEVFDGGIRATGRFRRAWGPAGARTYSWSETCERHWPWRRIHEVRRDPAGTP